MMFDQKLNNFGMLTNITQHILPYNLAMERLINYCIFCNPCTLRVCTQLIPHVTKSAQTLDYITLL